MSIDRRLGIAGAILTLFGIAAFYLWPTQKWIGWTSLALAGSLVLLWAILEIVHIWEERKQERQTESATPQAIGGPQIMVGYIRGNYLAVENNGGGIAYTVVFKVPDDGSIFYSRPINILRENLEPTPIQLRSGAMIEARTFVTHNAKGLPVIVECTDGDCRKFVYRFEKMTDQIGFLLKEKKCVGKDGFAYGQRALTWPEAKGAHITASSETIPPFPATLAGFRPVGEDKDFWNRPFRTIGSIRVTGKGWQGIPGFPCTMNGCSHGVFMVRWRSAHPNMHVRSSVRSLSKGGDDEQMGAFGYMSGNNCEQPMFKSNLTENVLVDLFYELKFWQAAP